MKKMTAYEDFLRKNELAIKASDGNYTDLNEILKIDNSRRIFEVFYRLYDSDKYPDELNVINIDTEDYNRIEVINLDLRNKDDNFIKELFNGAFNGHLESLKASYYDRDYGEYKYPGYIEASGYSEIADLIFNYVNLVEPGTESDYVYNRRFIRRDLISEKAWLYVRNITLRIHTKEDLDITMFNREV